MASALLENLTAASTLAASDLFYVKQAGARGLKATGTQLLTLVGTTYVPLAGGTMTGALTIASGNLTVSAGYMAATSCIANTGNLGLNSASGFIYWEASGNTRLYQDAAATLAQRNGTTQQISRIYNTYTDASNYERLTLTGVAGTSVNITAETLGTGGDNIDIVLTPAGTGGVALPAGVTATPGLKFTGTNAGFWYDSGAGLIGIRGYNATNPDVGIGNGVFRLKSAQSFGWSSGTDPTTTGTDTGLHRNAAGIVEVNNGTAGTFRDVKLRNLLNTEYHQMTEMTAPAAPATNSVRIYAEDNGAGKTRLMALFATGSAVQLGIEP